MTTEDSTLPEFPQQILPEGWQVEFFKPPITIDDAVRVTLPHGSFWTFFKTGNPSEEIAPFIYALMESLARASAGAVGTAQVLDNMTKTVRVSADTMQQLHKFLDSAAGEGLELDGVDAGDLCIRLFPEKYNAQSDPWMDGGA